MHTKRKVEGVVDGDGRSKPVFVVIALHIRHKIQNVTERIVFTVFGYGFWKKQPRKTLVSSRVKM